MELWMLQLIRSYLSYTMLLDCRILERTIQKWYCWINVDYDAVNLIRVLAWILFILFLVILFFYYNYCNQWYITSTPPLCEDSRQSWHKSWLLQTRFRFEETRKSPILEFTTKRKRLILRRIFFYQSCWIFLIAY